MDTSCSDALHKLLDSARALSQEPWQPSVEVAGDTCIRSGNVDVVVVPPGPLQQRISDFLCACAPGGRVEDVHKLMPALPQGHWESFSDGAGNLCIGCDDTPIAFVPPGPLQRLTADFVCACAPIHLQGIFRAGGWEPAATRNHGPQPDRLGQLDARVVDALQVREQQERRLGLYQPGIETTFSGTVSWDNGEFIRHLAQLSPTECLASCLAMGMKETALMLAQANLLHCMDRRGNAGLVVQRFQYLLQAGMLPLLWDEVPAQTMKIVLLILEGRDDDACSDDAMARTGASANDPSSQLAGPLYAKWPFEWKA